MIDTHKDDPPCHVNEKVPSGAGTIEGWSVEARFNYPEPEVIAGVLLDDRWRSLHFKSGQTVGIPDTRPHSPLTLTGLYEYASAQALRWWFIAEATRNFNHLCVETRLVRHTVEYSYSATAVEAVENANWQPPRKKESKDYV